MAVYLAQFLHNTTVFASHCVATIPTLKETGTGGFSCATIVAHKLIHIHSLHAWNWIASHYTVGFFWFISTVGGPSALFFYSFQELPFLQVSLRMFLFLLSLKLPLSSS